MKQVTSCRRVRSANKHAFGGNETDLEKAIAVYGGYVFDKDLQSRCVAMVNPGFSGKNLKCDVCSERHIKPFEIVIRFQGQGDGYGSVKGIVPMARRFAPDCLRTSRTRLACVSKDVPLNQGLDSWPPKTIFVGAGTIPERLRPTLEALQTRKSLGVTLKFVAADRVRFTALRQLESIDQTRLDPPSLPPRENISKVSKSNADIWRLAFMIPTREFPSRVGQKRGVLLTSAGYRDRRLMVQRVDEARTESPPPPVLAESPQPVAAAAATVHTGPAWQIEVDAENTLEIPPRCLAQTIKALLPLLKTRYEDTDNPSPLKTMRDNGMSWRPTLRSHAVKAYEGLSEAAVTLAETLVEAHFPDHDKDPDDVGGHVLHDILLPESLLMLKAVVLRVRPTADALTAEVKSRKGTRWPFYADQLEQQAIIDFFSKFEANVHTDTRPSKRLRVDKSKAPTMPAASGGLEMEDAMGAQNWDLLEPRLELELCKADNIRAVACEIDGDEHGFANTVVGLDAPESDDGLVAYAHGTPTVRAELQFDEDGEAEVPWPRGWPSRLERNEVEFSARHPGLSVRGDVQGGQRINMLAHLQVGTTVGVFFCSGYDDWYVGRITQIGPFSPTKMNRPAKVKYDTGGPISYEFPIHCYGSHYLWVIMFPPPDA